MHKALHFPLFSTTPPGRGRGRGRGFTSFGTKGSWITPFSPDLPLENPFIGWTSTRQGRGGGSRGWGERPLAAVPGSLLGYKLATPPGVPLAVRKALAEAPVLRKPGVGVAGVVEGSPVLHPVGPPGPLGMGDQMQTVHSPKGAPPSNETVIMGICDHVL